MNDVLTIIRWMAILVMGASIASCKGGGEATCEKLHAMLVKCDAAFSDDKEKFVSICNEKSGEAEAKNQIRGEIACSGTESCREFKKCLEGEYDKRRDARKTMQLERDLGKLKKELQNTQYRDAAFTCDALLQSAPENEEANKLCHKLPRNAVAALRSDLVSMRDTGKAEKYFTKCFDLKEFASRISGDEKKAAETLCQEVDVSRTAHKALDATVRNIAARKIQIPFDCGFAMKQLSALKSEWSGQTQKAVAQKCFVELGALVLAAKVPGMKHTCEFNVKKVFDAAAKYNLKDKSLDPWLEKARSICGKK